MRAAHEALVDLRGLGVRERGRRERQRRVADAAEVVFREVGYEQAAMRAIAARAGVSVGTVFEFAPDKRSLLLLIFGPILNRLTDQAIATLDRGGSLVELFVHIFAERYRFFYDDVDLARHLVGELAFFPRDITPDSPVADYLAKRGLLREKIAQVVVEQQRRGRVDPTVDARDVVSIAMNNNLVEVREWLADERPDLDTGLRRLRTILTIALSGVVRNNGAGAVSDT
jgi:AcrR family transcriptional regulator